MLQKINLYTSFGVKAYKYYRFIVYTKNMFLTKESNRLISFFIQHNCIPHITQTKKTDNILKKLYQDITDGVSFINDLKTKKGPLFYKLKTGEITNINQIPKPSTFPPNSFPEEIRKQIDEYSLSLMSYSFQLFNRSISIFFLTEDGTPERNIETYNNYVDYMLVWLYIVNMYSSRSCAKECKIYIYHTSLLKQLPRSNIDILDRQHVNSAFTKTCPRDSEIVVFRKEEWFKCFMHETFHNFGLDFSDMNQSVCNEKILSMFPVSSEVNLYESYTEFWARLMNALFCSYVAMKKKDDIDEFLTNAEFFIRLERIFAFFQMTKVLNFMDMSYKNMYEKTAQSETIRRTMFKENTNVLSYHIITTSLLNSYQSFLGWCNTNNTIFLQFKKTTSNLESFCNFIEKKYKTQTMLDGVKCMENLLVKTQRSSKNKKSIGYLLKNLRMTICELG